MTPKSPSRPLRPSSRELANPAQSWWTRMEFGREDSALAALRAEAAQGRVPRDVYALFQEMEDKDGHLYAVLQTRKNGVLARERQVVPADESPRAIEAADTVRRLLDRIPDFEQGLTALLDALGKGFAAVEVLWREWPDGAIGPGSLRGRPQKLFAFQPDGALRLLIPPGGGATPGRETRRHPSRSAPPDGAATDDGFGMPKPDDLADSLELPLLPPPGGHSVFAPSIPLPDGKFLVLAFGSPYSNPYGKGLCLKCYWYYWFKKHNLKFWAIYNERFGAPAVVGKYGPGTSDDERARLLEVVDALQSDTGVTLPEGMALEFLEARRSGDGGTYRDFADWCNDEMSKIVLGGTLVASEGRRSGSLALGQVHQRVRAEYIESDAKILMECVNRQLVPWIARYNLPPDAPLPRWEIETQHDDDPREQAEIDRMLVGLGVPIPMEHFYRHYRRPVPKPGERTLRYDDHNLYQYHLQFGVLTINEVRESLGLPPVAWGEIPPRLFPPSNDPAAVASGGASRGIGRQEPRERAIEREAESEATSKED